ncbi:hypothetical protein M404DRAFT_1006172 [Pisolithus tinctorius Marx 270]|uniref:COPA/B TPR domain-containing protein n=1 Tax=Pisolithus tinctorius Marx 270 TaxID=870435 RepID=A0A0C3IK25_PISTI|nr:hypothetical protein M404DRAFT_1006172 [Pisolithus tinctorius Marx 270]
MCVLFLLADPRCSPLYILGYVPVHNRVYLADKDMNIYAYTLSLNVVEYQTAVLRGDMDSAAEILPSIPKEQLNKVARFLEARGMFLLSSSCPLQKKHYNKPCSIRHERTCALNIHRPRS